MKLLRTSLLGVVLALSATSPARAATPDALAPDASLRFSGGRAEPVPDTPWWERFGDPDLTRTVQAALAGNLDLERLRAVQRQVQAGALQSFSGIAPSISANSQISLAPTDSLGFGFVPPGASGGGQEQPKSYYNGNATLDGQWNLDVFGRNGASWRAAQRDIVASEGDLDGLAGQTAVLVANAYYDAVTAKERVTVLQAQIRTNEELLEVIELRYERGDATSLDVLQQRQTLASAQAQLPGARLLAETTAQRLAVLLGRPPMQPPSTAAALPDLSPQAIVGTPAELVDNRPDLRAEAARLQGTRDRRWAAYAATLPTIGVSGRLGYQYIDITEFTDQTFWNVSANVSIPLFSGGRNLGAVRQARAAHDVQSAAFEAAVLTAMQEVEGALSQERLQREAVAAQEAQLAAATSAAETARSQYLEGLAPFVNVQSAITRQQQAELTLLQARRDLVSARISLHNAVGGPWTRALGVTPSSVSSVSTNPSEAR